MTEDGAAKPSEAAPDEDELKTKRAYRETTGSGDERKTEDDIDEAVEESFPASDPPSYSKGLPTTG